MPILIRIMCKSAVHRIRHAISPRKDLYLVYHYALHSIYLTLIVGCTDIFVPPPGDRGGGGVSNRNRNIIIGVVVPFVVLAVVCIAIFLYVRKKSNAELEKREAYNILSFRFLTFARFLDSSRFRFPLSRFRLADAFIDVRHEDKSSKRWTTCHQKNKRQPEEPQKKPTQRRPSANYARFDLSIAHCHAVTRWCAQYAKPFCWSAPYLLLTYNPRHRTHYVTLALFDKAIGKRVQEANTVNMTIITIIIIILYILEIILKYLYEISVHCKQKKLKKIK